GKCQSGTSPAPAAGPEEGCAGRSGQPLRPTTPGGIPFAAEPGPRAGGGQRSRVNSVESVDSGENAQVHADGRLRSDAIGIRKPTTGRGTFTPGPRIRGGSMRGTRLGVGILVLTAIVSAMGAAPAAPSYSPVEKPVKKIRGEWANPGAPAEPNAPGWNA